MKSIGYHAFYDIQKNLFCCSKKSNKYPLVVNCAGITNLEKPFTTVNTIGRADYYLLLIVKGELDIGFPDGMKKCGSGTAVIFPPETPYTYSLTSNEAMIYYYVHFSGSDVPNILSEYGLDLHPEYINNIPFDTALDTSFAILFDSFARTDRLREKEMYLNLEKILMNISRSIESTALSSAQKLTKSISYINSNYSKSIKVKELAEMEKMSLSSYNSAFVKIFGMAPGEYIINRRLSTACSLLTDTDIPINEIGSICGYSDSHFFSKIFKSHFGFSPRIYRNRKRTAHQK